MARSSLLDRPATMVSRRPHPREVGFTLVELMIVVVIVGVLAVLAVVGFRKLISEARTTEASQMIQSIRVAQESFHAETGTYDDLAAGDITACVTSVTCAYFYPHKPDGVSTVGDFKASWGLPCGGACNAGTDWLQLAVHPPGPVMFGYTTIAGFASNGSPVSAHNVSPPSTMGTTGASIALNWPTAGTPTDWYMISATGDEDRDGIPCVLVATSFSGDLIISGEGN